MMNIFLDDIFKIADHLPATPDKTRTKLLPQPITYGKAISWLRAILHSQQVSMTCINRTTLHSLRLDGRNRFPPKPSAGTTTLHRQINTADVYTRDHRGVINSIWRQVTHTLQTTPMTTDIEVPTETTEPHKPRGTHVPKHMGPLLCWTCATNTDCLVPLSHNACSATG